MPDLNADALLGLGRALVDRGYRFTTVTPETHRRVNARGAEGRSLADVFGWSRPFRAEVLPAEILGLLEAARAVEEVGPLRRSRVRFSTLGADLYVHSAWPTTAADAVFFGPDTYRFARLLRQVLPARVGRLVDLGCGSGAGGLSVRDRAEHVVLTDVNEGALRLAGVNAALAARMVELVESDVLASVTGPIDAIVANPPYLVDDARRYRDGGGRRGIDLAVRIVAEGLERLSPGGLLVLYSGTPVVDGVPVLAEALAPLLRGRAAEWDELDPDVFGEELDRPAYADVDRISVVSVVVRT